MNNVPTRREQPRRQDLTSSCHCVRSDEKAQVFDPTRKSPKIFSIGSARTWRLQQQQRQCVNLVAKWHKLDTACNFFKIDEVISGEKESKANCACRTQWDYRAPSRFASIILFPWVTLQLCGEFFVCFSSFEKRKNSTRSNHKNPPLSTPQIPTTCHFVHLFDLNITIIQRWRLFNRW